MRKVRRLAQEVLSAQSLECAHSIRNRYAPFGKNVPLFLPQRRKVLTICGGIGPQYFQFVVITFDKHQPKKNRRVYENYLCAFRQAEELIVDSLNDRSKKLILLHYFV